MSNNNYNLIDDIARRVIYHDHHFMSILTSLDTALYRTDYTAVVYFVELSAPT
jgi:hypothetical protein